MENTKKFRKATHAGSWYERSKEKLENTLRSFLTKANALDLSGKQIKGLIGPHAGFEYSGPTAAFAYININPINYRRVFLLGPSHHTYMDCCGLPYADWYETPLGNIEIDTEITCKLKKEKGFTTLKKTEEENEHSLEMHLPFIKKIFGDNEFKLVPIMVGHIDKKSQEYYGKIFAEYLKDEKNLFIVSSDFCHWGSHFDYQPLDGNVKETFKYIEQLDKEGIRHIEQQNPNAFADYLDDTSNTVCGCHPILCYLYALRNCGLETNTQLVRYNQSSQVKSSRDSSVSYAAIITTTPEKC